MEYSRYMTSIHTGFSDRQTLKWLWSVPCKKSGYMTINYSYGTEESVCQAIDIVTPDLGACMKDGKASKIKISKCLMMRPNPNPNPNPKIPHSTVNPSLKEDAITGVSRFLEMRGGT